jgi:hypothetical protein
MDNRNWFHILIAAVSAFYFGYLYGRREAESGVKAGEIVIEGKRIQVPASVYETIKRLAGEFKK